MRIAVIGLGGVGEACAHLLASRPYVRRLVVANRTIGAAQAVKLDLEQSRAWLGSLTVVAAEPWELGAYRDCDMLVLAVGERLRGNQERAEKAKSTASALRGNEGESILDALRAHRSTAEETLLLVVTNPVEATVTWLAQATGWRRERIIGLGTTVESARFSQILADDLAVDASSVWTEIVGEHGREIDIRDEEALKRRLADLGSPDLDLSRVRERTLNAAEGIRKYSEAIGRQRAEKMLEDFQEGIDPHVRSALLERLTEALCPPATRYAIAAAVLEVVEAVANDRQRLLTVSGFHRFVGLPDVALAMPFAVGRSGVGAPAMKTPSPAMRAAAPAIAEQVAVMQTVRGREGDVPAT